MEEFMRLLFCLFSGGCVWSQPRWPPGREPGWNWRPGSHTVSVRKSRGNEVQPLEAQASIQAREFRHGQDAFVSALHPSGTKKCLRGITVPSSRTAGLRLVRVDKREL